MNSVLTLICLFFLTITTLAYDWSRVECYPKDPTTVPHYNPNANLSQIYYGGNFVCGLTCKGYCDYTPAWRPELKDAFKCQCPVKDGCNENGPITGYEEHGDQYPTCRKLKSCNCKFQPNALQPSNLKYDCYYCQMQPNNWSSYYACCPIV